MELVHDVARDLGLQREDIAGWPDEMPRPPHGRAVPASHQLDPHDDRVVTPFENTREYGRDTELAPGLVRQNPEPLVSRRLAGGRLSDRG
jgi:hypothetical protein